MARSHAAKLVVLLALLASLAFGLGCASLRGARLYSHGTAALDRGDAMRAVADLEAAARLVPHGSQIQNHLGIAYTELGRDEDALHAFRRAVALDCDNQAAQQNLSVAERALGSP